VFALGAFWDAVADDATVDDGVRADLQADASAMGHSLMEEVDVLSGVTPLHYCNIGKSASQSLYSLALQNCKSFAVVGFWNLNSESDDTFTCNRFFIIPNPMSREVKSVSGTHLWQVLYSSPHTKDVFFFFKGHKRSLGDDLEAEESKEYHLQCALLKLTLSEQERATVGELRNINMHCHSFTAIGEGSILHRYVNDMHNTEFDNSELLPNVTMINSVPHKKIVERGGKTLVFTAFL